MVKREFLAIVGALVMFTGMAMGDSESLIIPALMVIFGGLMAIKNAPTGCNQ